MRKSPFMAVAALTLAILAVPSGAQAQMVTSTSPESIKLILEARGWPAALKTPADDKPYIESSYNDMKFLVLFMNCDDKNRNCKTLQYYMGFTDAKETTLDQLNEWNKTKRFARAYRDESGDPVLEMDLDLDFAGLPKANVNESFVTWAALMDAYHEFLFAK